MEKERKSRVQQSSSKSFSLFVGAWWSCSGFHVGHRAFLSNLEYRQSRIDDTSHPGAFSVLHAGSVFADRNDHCLTESSGCFSESLPGSVFFNYLVDLKALRLLHGDSASSSMRRLGTAEVNLNSGSQASGPSLLGVGKGGGTA